MCQGLSHPNLQSEDEHGKDFAGGRRRRRGTGPNPVRKCNWIRNCRPLKIHDDLYVLYFRWGGRASFANSSGPFDELPYINYTVCIVKFHRAISASLFLLSPLLLSLFLIFIFFSLSLLSFKSLRLPISLKYYFILFFSPSKYL